MPNWCITRITINHDDENKLYFYTISNCLDGINWIRVYKSVEFPYGQFKNYISISSFKLCKCDKTKEIKFEIFEQLPSDGVDNSANSEQTIQTLPHPIAQEIVTVSQLSDPSYIPNGCVLNLTKPIKKTNKGVITVNHPTNNKNTNINTNGGYNDNLRNQSNCSQGKDNSTLYQITVNYSEREISSFIEYIKLRDFTL